VIDQPPADEPQREAPLEPTAAPEAPAAEEPQQPPSEPRSEAKPSLLQRALSLVGGEKREAASDVQDGTPESDWRPPRTRDEFDRQVQAESDRRDNRRIQEEAKRAQEVREQAVEDIDRQIRTLRASDDWEKDSKIAGLAARRLDLTDEHRQSLLGQDELDKLIATHRRDYDRDTLDVWIEDLSLDPKEFTGNRREVAKKFMVAAKEAGGAEMLAEIMEGKTETAKAFRMRMLAEWNKETALEQPSHVDGLGNDGPLTPAKWAAMDYAARQKWRRENPGAVDAMWQRSNSLASVNGGA
jgi:hypothetical protein